MMHKHEEIIAELEETRAKLLNENAELNFKIHRKDAEIEDLETEMEDLRTALCEEKLKYVNLLERSIAMMEKTVGIENAKGGERHKNCDNL